MSGSDRPRYSIFHRILRKLDRKTYKFRSKLNLIKKVNLDNEARIGIYVAYYDASWVFKEHLRSIRDLTEGLINYYVMGNCTSKEERAWFDTAVSDFEFPITFYPKPGLMPLTHGESLQRMVDRTNDEIIVLCDVDAFPLKYGWGW